MKADAGHEQARQDAGAVREEAAELRERVDALQAQVTELARDLAEVIAAARWRVAWRWTASFPEV